MTDELIDKLVTLAEWIIRIDLNNAGRRNLPKPVREMSPDEHAIYNLAARYAGQFMFLTQEATNIMMELDPHRLEVLHTSASPKEMDMTEKSDAIAEYLIHQEALRQAADHGDTATMEAILARISAEVTKQAAKKRTGN